MKMEFLKFFTAVTLWLVESTSAQTVFTKSDFGSLVTSFTGNGCPRTHKKLDKAYYRYLQGSQKNSTILYVGAMNNLYKLEIPSLTCLNNTESIPDSETQRRCRIQGKSPTPDCQNHIRVVMELPDYLLVCGTGAYAPKRYKQNDNLENNETDTGVAMCPFDPLDNYTAILVTEGNPCNATVPYFGTYTDFIKSQPVLYRPSFTCPEGDQSHSEKTTDREDINWFNSPQFVGSYDDPEKVMFFFRETSVEHPTLKDKTFSRVGKVCKQDLGGGYMDVAKKKWLSFQKARLICSVPGNTPYYYDDIYDVYESGDQYFALFYRHTGVDSSGSEYSHIVASSAICVYEKEEIEKVFGGKFQYRSSQDLWETLPDNQNPNPRLDNCSAHRDNPNIFQNLVSQYQLMAENVKPMYAQPIFSKPGVQFINIAVSETKTSDPTTGRNIYLASTEGEIYDIFYKTFDPLTSTEVPYLTSKSPTIYRPFGSDRDADYTVWDMKYLNNTLLLGTDYEVTRLDLDICRKVTKIDVCILNTNCRWCKGTLSCIPSDSQSDCDAFLDWTRVGTQGVLESLKDEIDSRVVELQAVGEGLYTTLPLSAQVHVDLVIWLRSLECSGNSVLEENSEKYAQTSAGDLVIKNLKTEDNNATFTACSWATNSINRVKLKGYKIKIAEGNDQIIEVWKQQFNDWSSAFVKWKGCADDYIDTCSKAP